MLERGEYDDEGNETKAPVLSSKYHLDVAWQLEDTYREDGELIKADHPYGWKSASVDLDSNGVHSFYGIDYLSINYNDITRFENRLFKRYNFRCKLYTHRE